uniref:Transposase n=1 Tax=Ditylenchus dipsaci TaxID=166011 RepID=A0A915DES4_9BILA
MENIIANYGSSSESKDEQVKTPRKLKSYSTEFKLKVAKNAKDISIHGASDKFKVGRSTLSLLRHIAKISCLKWSSSLQSSWLQLSILVSGPAKVRHHKRSFATASLLYAGKKVEKLLKNVNGPCQKKN